MYIEITSSVRQKMNFQDLLQAVKDRALSPETHLRELEDTMVSLEKVKLEESNTQLKNEEKKRPKRIAEIQQELVSMGGKSEFGALPDGFMSNGEWKQKLKYLDATLACLEQRTEQMKAANRRVQACSPFMSPTEQHNVEVMENLKRIYGVQNDKLQLLRSFKPMPDEEAYLARKHALLREEMQLRLEAD